MMIALFWIGFSAAVATAANTRGRSPTGWFVLSLIISPLLAVCFLAKLLTQIGERAGREAVRAAEQEAAAPVPVTAGRVRFEGTVLSVREPDGESQYSAWKMLVKHDSGYKLWGTVPASRPTSGKVLAEAAEAVSSYAARNPVTCNQ
jgi:hypothetical protein